MYQVCAVCLYIFIYVYFVSSHAVNLLNNLPVSCLDVLIDVPSQEGQENYGGKNMDAVQKLLDFMEKRLNKVKFRPSTANTWRTGSIVYTLKIPN